MYGAIHLYLPLNIQTMEGDFYYGLGAIIHLKRFLNNMLYIMVKCMFKGCSSMDIGK